MQIGRGWLIDRFRGEGGAVDFPAAVFRDRPANSGREPGRVCFAVPNQAGYTVPAQDAKWKKFRLKGVCVSMKWITLCIGLSLLGLCACSSRNSLTQASGERLIQSKIDKSSLGIFLVGYSAVLPYVEKETYQDYTVNTSGQPGIQMLQRLILSGLVVEHRNSAPFPDVSGTYSGLFGGVEEYSPVRLTMGREGPAVSGSSVERKLNGNSPGPIGCEGRISGHVNQNNTVTLDFTATTILYGCLTPGEITFSVGRSELRDVVRTTTGNKYVFDLSGKRTGGTINVQRYVYDFTSRFMAVHKGGARVEGGHVKVVSVEPILLGDTATSAEAQFHWRVPLNPVGKAIMNRGDVTGVGSAEFRKTTEGGWLCTAVRL